MKKKYHCSETKGDFIELEFTKTGINFLTLATFRYGIIHLTDEDASKLSNDIKEVLTNKILNIGE